MTVDAVTSNFRMTIADGPHCGATFPAGFIWSSEDPVLFSLGMRPSPFEYVDWTIGRELLKEAVYGQTGREVGEGDVQLVRTDYGRLRIILKPELHETAIMEMSLTVAQIFLEDTETHTPVGAEDLTDSVNRALALILG